MSRRRLIGGAASYLVLALALQVDAAQAQDAGLVAAPAPPLASPSTGPLFGVAPSAYGGSLPDSDELRGGPAPKSLPSGVANYGQPRARSKLPKPYPPLRLHAGGKRHFKNELPPLEAYKNSAVARRTLRLGARDPAEAALLKDDVPSTVAVAPTIKAKPRPKQEVDPYAPTGVGIGSMRLDPFVETSGGYDTNPDRLPSSNAPKGSAFARADAGFKLRSDWSRNELDADMRLGYADYFDYPIANRPDGAGNLVARYDVTRDTAIDVLGRYTLDTQRPGSPSISSGVATVTVTNRPIIFSAGTSVGATQKFNRLQISIRGSFDRVFYQDAYYSDGSSLDLSSTSYNDYGVTGEVAYELSPSLKPVAEAIYDKRIHDQTVDPYGYYRDSNGYAARAGLRVKFTDLLSGEALGGYAERDYQDSRLVKLKGPTIDGKVTYTPTPLTTVNLSAVTVLNETTLSSASGALSHTFGADVSHDLFRNLRLTALGTYFINEYQGASITERGYTLGAKAEYRITRSLALRASYSHERLTSNQPGDSYVADVFMLGLRFQP